MKEVEARLPSQFLSSVIASARCKLLKIPSRWEVDALELKLCADEWLAIALFRRHGEKLQVGENRTREGQLRVGIWVNLVHPEVDLKFSHFVFSCATHS
jgi:hypothetical protein